MSARARVVRVLLVDDHRLVAEAIAHVLGAAEGISVVGLVTTVADVSRIDVRPDVVLMDYVLPDGTGSEATRIAKARWPRARVIMLSSRDDPETILEAVRAGADGYLTKADALASVADAVRAVMAGEVLLPPELVGTIARLLQEPPATGPPLQRLTPRELQVLRRLSAGESSRSIAATLGLSTETVRTHVQAVRRKLGARSRLEAVATATRRGLIGPPSDR